MKFKNKVNLLFFISKKIKYCIFCLFFQIIYYYLRFIMGSYYILASLYFSKVKFINAIINSNIKQIYNNYMNFILLYNLKLKKIIEEIKIYILL